MSAFHASARWPMRLVTTCVWALAAASVVFWGLRLGAPAAASAPPTVLPPAVEVDTAAVAAGLGAVSAPVADSGARAPEAASRFALWGVVADDASRGAALISFDGKPPRPYRVGDAVTEGYVVESVSPHGAALAASPGGPVVLMLQLPQRAPGAPRIVVSAGAASSPSSASVAVPIDSAGAAPAAVGMPPPAAQAAQAAFGAAMAGRAAGAAGAR